MAKRLVDLEVEEISGVDRAANMRKFLVIKQADGRFQVEGTNPLTPEQRGNIGDVANDPTVNEAWKAVLARLDAIVAADYSGHSREQILATALTSDAELKRLHGAWQRAMKSPTGAAVEKAAKEMVAKGATTLTFEQAYAKILQDNPELFAAMRAEERAVDMGISKKAADGPRLKDAAWSAIEKMGAAIKVQDPKLTIYEANNRAMDTELGRVLVDLERDPDAHLPTAYALEKIAKRSNDPTHQQQIQVAKSLLK